MLHFAFSETASTERGRENIISKSVRLILLKC